MGVTMNGRLTARPRPVPLPGEWTFWAEMMIGGAPLGLVNASGFSCTRRLSGIGNGQITVLLPSGIPPERIVRPWSYRVWCLYAGRPYWCGVPTGLADDSDSSLVTLTLTELPGYLARRLWDYPGSYTFSQVEQTEIARNIASPLSDVGVRIVPQAGTGFRRDRTYEYLEGASRAELLGNLAEVLDGIEYRIEYDVETAGGRAGLPRCTLRIAYPRVGVDAGLRLVVPGDALGYGATWDGDMLRTRTFAVGEMPENAPEGASRPVAVEERIQADLPRLDYADDWPGTILVSTLRERAAAMARKYASPVMEVTATAPEQAPDLMGYGPGDDVTVSLTTPLLPGGLDLTGRLTELTVAGEDGTIAWTIAADVPPPQARLTLNRRLDQLDRKTAAVFRARTAPLPAGVPALAPLPPEGETT